MCDKKRCKKQAFKSLKPNVLEHKTLNATLDNVVIFSKMNKL